MPMVLDRTQYEPRTPSEYCSPARLVTQVKPGALTQHAGVGGRPERLGDAAAAGAVHVLRAIGAAGVGLFAVLVDHADARSARERLRLDVDFGAREAAAGAAIGARARQTARALRRARVAHPQLATPRHQQRSQPQERVQSLHGTSVSPRRRTQGRYPPERASPRSLGRCRRRGPDAIVALPAASSAIQGARPSRPVWGVVTRAPREAPSPGRRLCVREGLLSPEGIA
jgi:hypothetical protein